MNIFKLKSHNLQMIYRIATNLPDPKISVFVTEVRKVDKPESDEGDPNPVGNLVICTICTNKNEYYSMLVSDVHGVSIVEYINRSAIHVGHQFDLIKYIKETCE